MARHATHIDWTPDSPKGALYRRLAEAYIELADLERAALVEAPAAPTPLHEASVYVPTGVAAARFGWHAHTIRRWAREGIVRSVSNGGQRRVCVADLEGMQGRKPGART